MDDVTWGALTLTLTLLGGLYTWFAFRSRGFVAGLRGVGFTLIPVALLLTDTLEMVTADRQCRRRLGRGLRVQPVQLARGHPRWRLGGLLRGGRLPRRPRRGRRGVRCVRRLREKPARKELGKGKGTKKEPVLSDVDPEMAEIEALLRKRGIT